jgi:hypothetical protein
MPAMQFAQRQSVKIVRCEWLGLGNRKNGADWGKSTPLAAANKSRSDSMAELEDRQVFQKGNDTDHDHHDLDDLAKAGLDGQALNQPEDEDHNKKRDQDANQYRSAHVFLQSRLYAHRSTCKT